MRQPQREDIIKRFDSLPEHLRSAIRSDKSLDTIWGFGEANHLSEQKIMRAADIVDAVILGFVHAEDLAKEFVSDVGLPADIANEFATEITKKILAPIMEEINSLYHWGTHIPPHKMTQAQQVAAPTQAIQVEEPQPKEKSGLSKLLSPVFREIVGTPDYSKYVNDVDETVDREIPVAPQVPQPQAPMPQTGWKEQAPQVPPQPTAPAPVEPGPQPQAGPTPFVIHQEEEFQPLVKEGMSPLDRPQFFKSTAEEKPETKPSTARLEIGEEPIRKPDEVGRTKQETPRVVNYTGPVTQVDPFVRPAGAQPAEKKDNAETHKVSPENIVNLKDLPK